MRIGMTIVSIGMTIVSIPLFAAEPPPKSRTYSVSVSHHSSITLSDAQARKILDDASKILKEENECNVTFKLKEPVKTFNSPETPSIVNESNIEAVHRFDESSDADLHVKVVKQITEFCRVRSQGGFNGCSWPIDFRSSIVVDSPTPAQGTADDPKKLTPILWTHELGHLMGIPHSTSRNSLMTGCHIRETDKVVTKDECLCFLSGPGVGGKCDLVHPIPSCSRP